MKRINIEDITWAINVEAEDMPVRGNAIASCDDETDRKYEDAILADIDRGNVWAWAQVSVCGEWNGIEEWEYLGGCSYESEEDFTSDDYYDDMREEIRTRIEERARDIAKAIAD